jgi:hypothetical protein
MHEFARFSQAIIHGAHSWKNAPTPELIKNYFTLFSQYPQKQYRKYRPSVHPVKSRNQK